LDPCTSVQLGSSATCAYSTSSCTSGEIQWNYPTGKCDWTFSPLGASSLLLRANWQAGVVNVSFFDGSERSAKLLGRVEATDEASSTIVSPTGTIVVRLHRSAAVTSYALLFNYQLTLNADPCSAWTDCDTCIRNGCSMAATCVSTCPTGAFCYKDSCASHQDSARVSTPQQDPASASHQDSASTSHQDFATLALRVSHDRKPSCSSQISCEQCIATGGCQWGGPFGQPASCITECPSHSRCEFSSICPIQQQQQQQQQQCANYKDCQACLNAGCFVVGLATPEGVSCVPQCYTDTPCYGEGQTCQDQVAVSVKTPLCAAQTSCALCQAQGCQWNSLALNCIVSCGFFPCQIQQQCSSGSHHFSWGSVAVLLLTGYYS